MKKGIILCLICLFVVGCTKKEEEKILTDLKEKYQETFTITGISKKGFIIGSEVSGVHFEAYYEKNLLKDNYLSSIILSLKPELLKIDEDLLIDIDEKTRIYVEIKDAFEDTNTYNNLISYLKSLKMIKILEKNGDIEIISRCFDGDHYHSLYQEKVTSNLQERKVDDLKEKVETLCPR